MSIKLIQNDFSRGQFSPLLIARTDLEFYMKGAKDLTNTQVIPQGGVQRRPGTIYRHSIEEGSENLTLEEYVFDEDNKYLLVIVPGKIRIYKKNNNSLVYTNNSAPWTESMVNNLHFTQNNDEMIISHADLKTKRLKRGADDATWTLDDLPYKRVPSYDFAKNYDSITFTLGTASAGTTTLTSSSALFNVNYVGGLFIGPGTSPDSPLGYARITGYNSDTQVTIKIRNDFVGTSLPGDDIVLTEPAFSDSRGWPVSCAFFENRLVFGGSKSLPDGLFYSKIGDYYNFDIGTGAPNDAIVERLGGDAKNTIKHIVNNRTLQVYTSEAEFSLPLENQQPLSPQTISIKLQSQNGTTRVKPQILDNVTFYVKKGGKGVQALMVSDATLTFSSKDVSVLSPELIKSPVDSTTLKGSQTQSADFLYLVNSDGTMSAFQSVADEGVSAWTPFKTDGKFKRITTVGSDVYIAIDREIDGQTKTYLEEMDLSLYMDSCVIKTYETPATEITEIGHLEGKTVNVRADGIILNERIVQNGKITIERASKFVEVGLKSSISITLNPVVINSQSGNLMYKKKRIIQVFVQVYKTFGVKVNDEIIPYLQFNDSAFEAPTPITGIQEIALSGWEKEPEITITQDDPAPLTILGVGYEVEV